MARRHELTPRTLWPAAMVFLFLPAGALLLQGQSVGAWTADPGHPQLKYRVKCAHDAATIEWRNGYPGEVTVKARVRSSTYEGEEDMTVAPGGLGSSDVDTLYCSPDSFHISLAKFTMKPPPPPPSKPALAGSPEPAPDPPPVPTIPRYVPPPKLPEVAADVFASVQVGMRQEDVVQRLGAPESKIAIPEESELIETYRYHITQDQVGIVRFANGVVQEVSKPKS
jgi:hypothetical protein